MLLDPSYLFRQSHNSLIPKTFILSDPWLNKSGNLFKPGPFLLPSSPDKGGATGKRTISDGNDRSRDGDGGERGAEGKRIISHSSDCCRNQNRSYVHTLIKSIVWYVGQVTRDGDVTVISARRAVDTRKIRDR